MLDLLFIEIRDAYRALTKKPALTLIAIVVVTIGITSVTSIFSVINTFLLVPSGYKDPDRLVGIIESSPAINVENYSSWLTGSTSFESFAGYKIEAFFVSNVLEPERMPGVRVSRSLLSVVGVQPVLGRGFAEKDSATVILSYSYWQKAFQHSSDVLGKVIKINGNPHTIIGVMPRGFSFPLKWEPNVWVPFGSIDEYKLPGKGKRVFFMCRLKQEMTIQRAQAEMDILSKNTGIKNYKMTLYPVQEESWKDLSRGTVLLAGAAIFVLLICCANISNLLASKGADRAKEVAIRKALGANRATLIRQFVIESIMIFLLGTGCALICTKWILDYVPIQIPTGITFNVESQIDWRMLCFSTAAGFLCAVASASIPALRFTHVDFSEALKEGGHRTQTDRSGRKIQRIYTIFQIAASVSLLVASGLLIKSLMKLYSLDHGYDPSNVTEILISLPPYKYKENPQWMSYSSELLNHLKQIPGIESFSVNGSYHARQITAADDKRIVEPISASSCSVSPDYFRTLKIPLRYGRDFSDLDSSSSQATIIISERTAKKLFGSDNVLGKKILLEDEDTPRTIIAVAGNVLDFYRDDNPGFEGFEIYVPFTQDPWLWMTAAVRSSRNTKSLAPELRRAVWKIDPELPLKLFTMEDEINESLGERRVLGLSLTIFAALSLFLTCIGIYGIILYSVVRRTYEIGVRIALGATSKNVLSVFFKETMTFVLIGTILGFIIALNFGKVLESFLWNVSPNDTFIYAIVLVAVSISSLLACAIPISKALKINPVQALRYE